MSRILDHIAELSPEKRALLALRNPLSFAQQRLWFLDQFEPASPFYNVSLGLRLNGRLDRRALHRALLEISRRHEVLRTVFVEIDGRPAQIVDPQIELALPLVDLTSLSDAGREAELKRLNWEQSRQPLTLASGNVLRAMLCRIKENDHAFLLTLHHIVSDAWSKDILIREMAELYQAFSTGRQSPLPDLPIQYADYAVWQRESLKGERLERQLTYWKDRLAGSPPLIGLHTDHPRSRVQTHSGATESRQLDDELSEALAVFGRERQATLFMVLLAALNVLLYRYTGQDDLLVGTPVSTRGRVETEGLIGCFLNTLVLRNDLSGDPDFQTVLERVREVTLGAFANQDLPFEMLIDEMQPERSLSHTPLFQVMFFHKIVTEGRRVAEEAKKSSDLSISACEEDNQTAKFDLTFGAVESGDRLTLGVEYKTDLFERSTILRMLDHCENLLRAVVADPLRPISELPLLSLRERQQLLLEIDNRASHYPSVCIHHLFEAHARAVPGNTALTYEGDQISYGQLNERANQLAHYLRSLGVGSEVLVAVCMKRSADLVTALLGVLKAGGAYVPLDPAYPHERLSFMLSDAGVEVLITEQALLGSLPEPGTKVVCIDSDWGKVARESGENLEVAAGGPDNLAYVIYTSGSTGKPKGVQISHRAVVNFLTSMRERPGLTDKDTLVAVTTLSFDIAGLELYLPLSVGARVVLVSREEASDPTRLADRLTTSGATVMQATPATWRMLLAAGWHDGSRLKILCGGEALPQELASELLGTGAELWNLYGPTETTIWSTVFNITKKDAPVLIGRPIANTQVYILDAHLQLVPIGVVGELFIGGDGLARGYLNRPELTAERLIPNPFGQVRGQRLYRTGDLARLGADGDLEYLGRSDFQTKVRGYRIELGEIETALRLCEGVKDAVVIVREDQPGDQRIVAYCVMDEPPAKVSELNRLLKEKLPIYMVPSFIVSLAEFPLTSSGKLNRKLLPSPDENAIESERISGPPSTPTQEIIAGTWAQVLKLESVGVKDNFFDLGGHSLLATRVISRFRESLNIEIPLKALFENPTVEELADYISSSEQSDLAAPIMRVSRDHLLPLSFAQERLWFLSQLDGANVAYNVPSILKLTGQLDEGALQRSLNRIVARHEVLRTRFVQQAGTPFQQVLSSLELQLPVIDLSQLDSQQRQEQLLRISTAEADHGFDLREAPLLRGLLIREAEQEYVLAVTMHHIISDAWSVGVMMRELAELYRAEVEGREAKIEELDVQYGDYAAWQREWLRGEVLEKEIRYWKEQLAAARHILDLPTDRPRPAIQTYRGARQSMALPRDLVAALERLSRDEGVTLFMVLLASFDTLLYRYTSQQEILVGTPVANRNRIELEGLVGLFLNTLVMRGDLSGNPTFRELLRRVRQDTLGAYTHQLVPFELVIEALQPERSLSHSPLFQVMLALQEEVEADWTMSDVVVSPQATEVSTSKFDLLLSCVHGKKSLGVMLEYNSDMFDDSTIAQMLGHWARLLEAVAANSRQRLSDLAMLTEAEYQQLICDWNDTARDFDGKCVHEMFEQQASEVPEALALVFGEKSITYGELNRSANQLAHYLRKLGAGADSPVGICVERSELAAIGVLGILKAGAAYVPIDPAYPKDRVAIILQDASIKILLSQTSVRDALPDHSASVIAMDRDWHSITSEAVETLGTLANPEPLAALDNLGYLIYTSGSTGRPKGIGLPHRALANLIQWQLGVNIKGARTLQFASLSFDVSFQEMFFAWCSKGTVYIIPESLRADTPALARYLNSNRIEKVTLPVVVLQNLAEEFAAKKSLPGSIKEITTTGEQLQITEPVKELFRRMEGCDFHNHYGPSETHVVTAYRMPHLVYKWPKYPPIGTPISNTQMYVLDKNLNPVPVGVYGELMIGGEMLARGYVNRADLTAEKFIPDPFSREAGSRLYRTGDLARYLRDGNIEFFGRIDHQVKIRGFRVELGEIEVLLEQHPEVRATVVVAQQYPNGEKRLVGYVVPHDKEKLTTSELRKYLAEKLPDYMIPSAFVLLDSLPLSHNRKVDRRALPLPNAERPSLEISYVAPSTPTEQVVARIWSSLLGVETVGVHDNFFDLGGHSLLATRLAYKIEEDFRVQIGLRALFQAPTVSGVVNSIVESWGDREIVDEIARTIMEVDQLDPDEVSMALGGAR
jgi:amino acid adenylation domain-containing protein